jgi:predicted alpha/beta-hydrolase family hydrolase
MPVEHTSIALPGAGVVSAEIALPSGHRPGQTAVILGHGAGNDMRNRLLSAVHAGLAERGLVAVKFNFPYTEAGRRAPDRMPVLEGCFARVVETVRGDERLRPARLVLGGKSMGGRVASHLAAQGVACDGLIFLGYPLHPAGKPERLRSAHLGAIRAPMLFFAGTRDPLCDLALLRPVLAGLQAPATLHVIEDGDHSFAVRKSAGRTRPVAEELVEVAAAWIQALK